MYHVVAGGKLKVETVRAVGVNVLSAWAGIASVIEYVLLYMNWIDTVYKMLLDVTKAAF